MGDTWKASHSPNVCMRPHWRGTAVRVPLLWRRSTPPLNRRRLCARLLVAIERSAVEHSYRSYRTRLGFVKLVQSLALVAATICSAASCSSSDTGSQQSTDGGPGDARAMGMPPEGVTQARRAVSDAGTTQRY